MSTDGCALPGYLFVVTYGRSGSTLLQGILNAIPGYCIRGESAGAHNRGAVHDLFAWNKSMLMHRAGHGGPASDLPTNAWYGIGGYPEAVALERIRELVVDTLIQPEPDARTIGFKEVRWAHQNLGEYLDFVGAVFPGARFIFNTRNVDDVIHSKWWRTFPNVREHILAIESRHSAARAALGLERAFGVHYDDYVHDPTKLRPLFAWLGEQFDEQRIREVMELPHSY